MFNVFQKELKEKELQNRSNQDIKEKKLKDKRKKILPDLVKKYDSRIKSFIIDMAQTPIKIRDYTSPIDNVRQKFMEDQNEKIKGKKGFIFKSFQTEKDRIKEYLKQREKDKIQTKSSNKIENVKLIQPNMRFKARTDLERIYDAVNGYSLGRAAKWIINRQLKDLDLNFAVKTKKKRDSEEIDSFNQTQNGEFNEFLENRESERLDKKKKRKAVDNSEAKNIMSELHKKTHFKAASVYTIQSRSRNFLNQGPSEEDPFENKQFINKTNVNNEIERHEIKRSSIIENLNVNPFNLKTQSRVNQEKLAYLQTISSLPSLNLVLENNIDARNLKKKVKFMNTNLSTDNKMYDNEITAAKIDERRKEDDMLLIDNHTYSRSQFDVLSKVVLRKCNFTHEKNKNNNKALKSGEGKLMITSGLTLHDFVEKYHF